MIPKWMTLLLGYNQRNLTIISHIDAYLTNIPQLVSSELSAQCCNASHCALL